MEKTLVIVLAETRAWEKTFENIKQNLLTPLNADLCLCIGVKNNYNYENPFYQTAKYRFTYDEPEDWGDAFNYAELFETNNNEKKVNIIDSSIYGGAKPPHSVYDPKWNGGADPPYTYINYKNTNAIWGKINEWNDSTDNIVFLGRFPNEQKILENENILSKFYEEIVYHSSNFISSEWRYCAYGIKKINHENIHENIVQDGINTLRLLKNNTEKSKWRRFLKIKDQFMGGIKDAENEHPGSAGILIFFRWFLLKKLKETNIINKYDRFIITRSDYIWRLEHPSISLLSNDKIWVPNCETYEGITDRHTVIPQKYMEQYCNILTAMLDKRTDYFNKMIKISHICSFNLEKLILFHLNECNIKHDFFPYVMFSIRPSNVSTRWASGTVYCKNEDYFIKYISEDKCSQFYVNDFINWKSNNINKNLIDYYYKNIPCEIKYYY